MWTQAGGFDPTTDNRGMASGLKVLLSCVAVQLTLGIEATLENVPVEIIQSDSPSTFSWPFPLENDENDAVSRAKRQTVGPGSWWEHSDSPFRIGMGNVWETSRDDLNKTFQCCREDLENFLTDVSAAYTDRWHVMLMPHANWTDGYKFSVWMNISCGAIVTDMLTDARYNVDCNQDGMMSPDMMMMFEDRTELDLMLEVPNPDLMQYVTMGVCCELDFPFPGMFVHAMETTTKVPTESTTTVPQFAPQPIDESDDDKAFPYLVVIVVVLIVILLGVAGKRVHTVRTKRRRPAGSEIYDRGDGLELVPVKKSRSNNSSGTKKTQKHRFENLEPEEWRRQICAAAESGFRRLRIVDPANRELAADTIQRILEGAKKDHPPHGCSSRGCFLVKRVEGSKSQYQVQVGIVRMIVQKAVFLAYNQLPAEAVNESGLIQQSCLYPDANWWCLEPTHLFRSEAMFVSPNIVKHPIPAEPHAILPVLRESKSKAAKTVIKKQKSPPMQPKLKTELVSVVNPAQPRDHGYNSLSSRSNTASPAASPDNVGQGQPDSYYYPQDIKPSINLPDAYQFNAQPGGITGNKERDMYLMGMRAGLMAVYQGGNNPGVTDKDNIVDLLRQLPGPQLLQVQGQMAPPVASAIPPPIGSQMMFGGAGNTSQTAESSFSVPGLPSSLDANSNIQPPTPLSGLPPNGDLFYDILNPNQDLSFPNSAIPYDQIGSTANNSVSGMHNKAYNFEIDLAAESSPDTDWCLDIPDDFENQITTLLQVKEQTNL